jgi:RNA polymerase sigma-70 factor (ECF subfamily)
LRPISWLRTDLYNRNVKQNEEINLVQAAAGGDIESFNRLCERYYPAIVAICYSQLADRDLAEDVAQEALFAAYRDLSKLKNTDRFGRWLTGICRNIAADMAKVRIKERQILTGDCNPVTIDGSKQKDHIELIKDIVSALPARLKEVIFLRFYNQMSYQEIANLLGISQQAVNGRLRRAKKIIAKELNRRDIAEVDL